MSNKGNASVPPQWSMQEKRFGETLKQNLEVLQGNRGDKLDRAVTFRDLLDTGIVRLAAGVTNFNGNSSSVAVVNEVPNLIIPPAPTNLQASGAFQNIILEWNLQIYAGHSFVQVFRHTSDVISSATLIAQVSGFTGVYSDAVGSGADFYYWVRAVNQNGVTGPFNSSTGTRGQTAPDVNFLLSTLTGAITSSELASSLSTPIGQIPGINTSISTINSNITALDNFTGFTSGYSGDSLLTRMGAVETTANGAATSAQLQSEQTTRANADTALASDITTLQSSVSTNAAAIQTEQTARANADSALSSDITSLTTTVNNNAAAISAETTARSNADSALASDITSLNTATSNNAAAISSETTARTNADSAIASDVSTLTTTVSGNTTSISTQATSINGLSAQYTVKIDNNGAISGYGLASNAVDGTIVSEFIVNANRFAIMNPSTTLTNASGSHNANVPFIVQSSATTINGVSVPAGVYITDAFVRNGSIVNAKIANAAIDNAKISSLSADKLTAGTVSTSRLNIDGATLTAHPVTGALQVNEISANKVTSGTIDAGVITVTNLDADEITGDVNVFQAVNSSSSVTLTNANQYYEILDVTLPAPAISHRPICSVVMQATKSSSGGTEVGMKITMQATAGTSNVSLGTVQSRSSTTNFGVTFYTITFSGDVTSSATAGSTIFNASNSSQTGTVTSVSYSSAVTTVQYVGNTFFAIGTSISVSGTNSNETVVFEGGQDQNFSNGQISQAASGSFSQAITTSVRVRVYAKKEGKTVVVNKVQGFLGGIR